MPIPLLPDLLAAIAAIAEAHDVEIPVVAPRRRRQHPPAHRLRRRRRRRRAPGATSAFDEVMAAAIALGGTITGEHGVGRPKAVALPDQLGPDVMALTRRIKDALDPDGILNPGKWV